MKTSSKILVLVSILTVACSDAKKQGDDKKTQAPAESTTGTDTDGKKGDGKKSGSSGGDSATDDTLGQQTTEIDWSAPLREIEVKAYHILPIEKGNKASGYCIANTVKVEFPPEAADVIKSGDGPCPETMDLDGEQASIAYVCPAYQTSAEKKSQTILYTKIKTSAGYESLKKVGPAIINAFCDKSNVQ